MALPCMMVSWEKTGVFNIKTGVKKKLVLQGTGLKVGFCSRW